ncbi:hypothetical protein ACSMFR_00710 [Listeria aquatica]|uniref:DUF1146 domain-containing protein n=1 Tax=Listeria aquatica FSL S10-1188 TaxID=1265818 RepID=W7AXT3_9LIST|nr:hypothetical protein [Listeria aquatica]EUJ18422.1 hypothetical protein MAQA_09369 [Listeria aquatica FSL S10-1188]
MSPQIVTYLVLILSGIYAIHVVFGLIRVRRQGETMYFRPFRFIAAIIVFLLALYAVTSNMTYDDLVVKIEDWFR